MNFSSEGILFIPSPSTFKNSYILLAYFAPQNSPIGSDKGSVAALAINNGLGAIKESKAC